MALTEHLDQLDALAAAATPGERYFDAGDETHEATVETVNGSYRMGRTNRYHDAAFIAAADPITVRALIAVARAARGVSGCAEPDDDPDGQFIEYLVDHDAIADLRAALAALEALP